MTLPIIAMVAAFLSTLAIGPLVIEKLRMFKMGQNIREDGPSSHLIKQGVPSMGGIMFLLTASLSAAVFSQFDGRVLFMVGAMLVFSFVGFLDDALKVRRKSSDGLSAKGKMGLLLAFGTLAALVLHLQFGFRSLAIPFTSHSLPLGWLYIPFVVIFFAAVTNAVNLTDGLDGLSSSVTSVVLLYFILLAHRVGDSGVLIFAMALLGGVLGFLKFNRYPAKVFMGDTGSLALGGGVGILALMTRSEVLLIFIGVVYVVETLSVILQVAYFKKTGRRILKMAPLHHHFEQLGWTETRIVGMFTLITVVMVAVATLLQ